MLETLNSKTRTARKDHDCMASVWITNNDLGGSNFTFPEWRAIAKAKANDWKILRGQKYNWASCKQDGELFIWKAIPELEAICHKYEYFVDC